MHEFYSQNVIYIYIQLVKNDGDGRKKPREKDKLDQKKNPFGYPPIPRL